MDYETARMENLPASSKSRSSARNPNPFSSVLRGLVDGQALLILFGEMGSHQSQNTIHSTCRPAGRSLGEYPYR